VLRAKNRQLLKLPRQQREPSGLSRIDQRSKQTSEQQKLAFKIAITFCFLPKNDRLMPFIEILHTNCLPQRNVTLCRNASNNLASSVAQNKY
jgi:hypothetical protein